MSLAIIPARGGSFRIKNKNIKLFFGKPIICYAIELAQKTKIFKKIVVSTDSYKIKKISEKAGADVFFLRPKKLSNHTTPIIDVISHAIKKLNSKGFKFEYTCCIFPVSPLLKKNMLLRARTVMIKKKLRYIFPVTKKTYSNENEIWVKNWKITNNKINSEKYYDAGQFYWGKSISWEKKKKIFSKLSGVIFFEKSNLIDVNFNKDWKTLKNIYKKKN